MVASSAIQESTLDELFSPYDGFLPVGVSAPPSSDCDAGPDSFDKSER